MNTQTENSMKLFDTAKANLGQLLSGDNTGLGCAITVNALATKAWGHPIGGGASTHDMYACLEDATKYTPILLANVLAGDIIISPTGYATDPTHHGHVGVVAQFGILSNLSEDGRLHEQWTIPAWEKYYVETLGFPMKFFRAI